MDKKVWQLNASTRRARYENLLTLIIRIVKQYLFLMIKLIVFFSRLATASSETVEPVITSKLTEVFFWGAGKQIPQKIDAFIRGNSALQVLISLVSISLVTY